MNSLLIKNLGELKNKLRIQAARHGHSIEEEARQILRAALLNEQSSSYNLGQRIHKRFAGLGGVELLIMPRDKLREPLEF